LGFQGVKAGSADGVTAHRPGNELLEMIRAAVADDADNVFDLFQSADGASRNFAS